jgi:hypothetical protein
MKVTMKKILLLCFLISNLRGMETDLQEIDDNEAMRASLRAAIRTELAALMRNNVTIKQEDLIQTSEDGEPLGDKKPKEPRDFTEAS